MLGFNRRRRLVYALAAGVFLFGCVLIMRRLTASENDDEERLHKLKITKDDTEWMRWLDPEAFVANLNQTFNMTINFKHTKEYQLRILNRDDAGLNSNVDKTVNDDRGLDFKTSLEIGPPPNYNVHIFYYAWYGNPIVDGKYVHWNHKFLPHWKSEIAKKYRQGKHEPPDDIGSNFYPALGPYSSRDIKVIHNHMKQLCFAGVGVLAVSWYPSEKADEQGGPPDSLIPTLMDIALMYDLRVTLHIEPYKGRNDKTLQDDVQYIIKTYGNHKGFYKHKHRDGRELPLLYIYDSYRTPDSDWANLLKPEGSHSIRNTKYDCIFIALVVESKHKDVITVGGFDGFYTYFATDGFSFGSTWRTWSKLASFAKQTNTLFIPSVGPGYIDTNVRPWNSQNTRLRQNGQYYTKSWNSALSIKPDIVSITSFNEWHEGTQIEKAISKKVQGQVYKDYAPNTPDFYLKLTRKFIAKFNETQNTSQK
ncbi:hypothetical protein QZH41_007388 [Actinostola sp. cb2023]|nr:hypothetical protein QZH41_007388 [Actinostola sp. cb2023]